MGCSFSGLNALYDNVNGGADVWINENRFRIVRQLDEGGFSYVYLVKEVVTDSSPALSGGGLSKKLKDSSHVSDDGTYAMKKVLIQNNEQLELVKEEIRVSSLFSHPNLLPLLDHAIISVKPTKETSGNHEAYLLFPVNLDGTLLDIAQSMKAKNEFFSTSDVLHIFQQLAAGLKHMHTMDPPHAHNDVKPGNVVITLRKGQPPLAILMDFGSTRPARRKFHSRSEALQLQTTSIKLDGMNFLVWELVVLPLIEGNKLQSHIDGSGSIPARTLLLPDETEVIVNPAFEDWYATDHMLVGWLCNTMTQDDRAQLSHCQTAQELWTCARLLTCAVSKSCFDLQIRAPSDL